jgi:putative SOS response-associated peptidase YedK
VSEYFGAYPDDDLPDGLYNVPPTETIRMIVNRDGERRLAAARWRFQPCWTENAAAGTPRSWINARAETAAASPAFGPAIRSTRCVIPADLFYEWDRTVRPRQPFAIGPASDGEMLALAGIWSRSRAFGVTAAILTTHPNELVAPIHNRMPVILSRDLLDAWLDPLASLAELEPMLAPAPEETLRLWPVSTEVNKVAADGPHLLRPIDLPVNLGLA